MDKTGIWVALTLATAVALGLGYWLLPSGALRDVIIVILAICILIEFPLWYFTIRDD